YLANYFLDAELPDLTVLGLLGVLGRNDDVGNAYDFAVLVNDGNLRFCVRTKPGAFAILADTRELTAKPMRVHDWRRHEFGCFVAGITKHQSLVARALLGMSLALRFGPIDALRNVG